ncbi:hypothetical protein [Solibacillus sp. FSL W7-1324]|uniref:hypothetical protein n=1 Tax=Solibacillus sp. FSL W7-1324 TaxID=2921701 RepID=UPI0030F7C364
MKKGLIISKEYYPMSNGSITCLENIINKLKDNYEITVVGYNLAGEFLDYEKKNGIEIYRIYSKYDLPVTKRNRFLEKRAQNQELWGKITKLPYIPFYFNAMKKGLIYPIAWSRNALEYIEKLIVPSKFDFILAIGGPFENVRTGVQLSEKYDIPLYIIEFDLFAYNPTHNLLNIEAVKQNLEEELTWYKQANHIFVTKEMYKTVLNSELNKYKEKITAINMPNLVPLISKANNRDEEGYVDILYAGMFYEDIRNPSTMLKIFSKVFQTNSKIRLHILGIGCENITFKYQKEWPNNIFLYGKQTKDKVNELIKKSNFLLNLSNAIATQAPSKIVEYISTCKPIINFYSIDKDLCVDILKNYSLSISLDQRQGQEELSLTLLEFIRENEGKTNNIDEITYMYSEYTPQYVANKIIDVLEG